MGEHEYSVVGHSRTSIGRYLAIFSAIVASTFTGAGVGLANLAATWGLPSWTQSILMVPISAAVVYLIVHFIFNKWGWKLLSFVSSIPNIDGQWECKGQTIENEAVKYEWSGAVHISQNWEKIRVYLRTAQSASSSVSAALVPEGGKRWMLMYSYRNEPRTGEPLNPHLGYCELSFDPGSKRAEGDYFNARGRGTCGKMILTRSKSNGA
ncbi:Cap15 family CBASS effector [Phyllobacterium sp. 22229]|uniref:Cap15 family cyclic dinucleotide receptor domain-containing protein n=1 Tax=Phyllobacterium sp. 22229 TaxID=3453895 RepID=UPI003F83278C